MECRIFLHHSPPHYGTWSCAPWLFSARSPGPSVSALPVRPGHNPCWKEAITFSGIRSLGHHFLWQSGSFSKSAWCPWQTGKNPSPPWLTLANSSITEAAPGLLSHTTPLHALSLHRCPHSAHDLSKKATNQLCKHMMKMLGAREGRSACIW